jgi:hypothetical protein
LTRVARFTVRISYPGTGSPGIRHQGGGEVAVERHLGEAGEAVVWRESGRWEAGPLAGITFHNSTLWRRLAPDRLELSHLRRGVQQPTLLVELRPSADHPAWLSTAPHLCGPDRYTARLTCEPQALDLAWEVQSPTDPYLLEWSGRFG